MRDLQYCEICGLLIAEPTHEAEGAQGYICEKCLGSRKVILTTTEATEDEEGIRFRCPDCDALLQANHIPGKARLRCPRCGSEFYAHEDGAVEPVTDTEEEPEEEAPPTIQRTSFFEDADEEVEETAEAPSVERLRPDVQGYFSDLEDDGEEEVEVGKVEKEAYFEDREDIEVGSSDVQTYFSDIDEEEVADLAPDADEVDVLPAIEQATTEDEEAITGVRQRERKERLDAARDSGADWMAQTVDADEEPPASRRVPDEASRAPAGVSSDVPSAEPDRDGPARRPIGIQQEAGGETVVGTNRGTIILVVLTIPLVVALVLLVASGPEGLAGRLDGIAGQGIRQLDDAMLDLIPDEDDPPPPAPAG